MAAGYSTGLWRDDDTPTVALISAVSPYPTDSGKKVVIARLVEYLIDRVGPDAVTYVHVSAAGTPTAAVPTPVQRLSAPRPSEQLRSVVTRTLAGGRHSLQESSLYSPRLRDEMQDVLNRVRPDIEIYDTVRMGQYAPYIAKKRPGVRRVLYLDDLFSVRYRRILQTQREHGDVQISALGDFGALLPVPARRLAENEAVQRALLRAEGRLIAHREIASVRDFDVSCLISATETTRLAALTGSDRVRTLPPIVEADPLPRAPRSRPMYLLLGLLSLPHNHDAVLTFLRTAMPGLLRRQPDAVVHVVGRGATPEVVDAAGAFPGNVVLSGYVPDLRQLMATATALLVPLRFGSGVKIKVMEGLAHGVPVIATPVGVEGVASGEDFGVLVEPDISRFPEAMVGLADPARNADLSARALRHHRATYTREAAYPRYDEIFGLDGRCATRPA